MWTERFPETPLLGILRGLRPEEVEPVVELSVRCGLAALEVTLNTDGALDLISRMKAAAGDRLQIGAGTVLSRAEMLGALDAGAEFVVSPVFVPEISEECRKRGVPNFPGAFTPQEIFAAWKAGAEMVKVFPAGALGPSYISDVKGPFRDIPLMAVGGVNEGNVGEFFRRGVSGVACGASVFRREWLGSGDFASVEGALAKLAGAVREAARR